MTWRSFGASLCLMLGIIFISAHVHPDPPLWQELISNIIGAAFLVAAVDLIVRERPS